MANTEKPTTTPSFAFLYRHEVCEDSDDEDFPTYNKSSTRTSLSTATSDFDISNPKHAPPGSRVVYDPRDNTCILSSILQEVIIEGEGYVPSSTTSEDEHIPSGERRPNNDETAVHRTPNSSGNLVRFGNLHIREYERAIGDTPCATGPPISIGWKYRVYEKNPSKYSQKFTNGDNTPRSAATEVVVSVDKYERLRCPRGPLKNIILSRNEKEDLLIDMGVARREIAEAVRQNLLVKHQRRQTVTNLKLEPMEEKFERWARSLRKVVMLGTVKRRKSKSRHLLDQWLHESGRRSYRLSSNSVPLKGILIKEPESRRLQKKENS